MRVITYEVTYYDRPALITQSRDAAVSAARDANAREIVKVIKDFGCEVSRGVTPASAVGNGIWL